MSFSLKCVQCMVTRPAIHAWCNAWYKKFAHGRESFADEERSCRCVVSTTDATIAAVDSTCGLTNM